MAVAGNLQWQEAPSSGGSTPTEVECSGRALTAVVEGIRLASGYDEGEVVAELGFRAEVAEFAVLGGGTAD